MSHHRAASRPRQSSHRGFTLFETMIAIVVITAGLLAVGALVAKMNTTTSKSRYISVQAYLASEKMDELSRYPGVRGRSDDTVNRHCDFRRHYGERGLLRSGADFGGPGHNVGNDETKRLDNQRRNLHHD